MPSANAERSDQMQGPKVRQQGGRSRCKCLREGGARGGWCGTREKRHSQILSVSVISSRSTQHRTAPHQISLVSLQGGDTTRALSDLHKHSRSMDSIRQIHNPLALLCPRVARVIAPVQRFIRTTKNVDLHNHERRYAFTSSQRTDHLSQHTTRTVKHAPGPRYTQPCC